MAYQGTNLVPSSQQDSCTMHGFAAAEIGPSHIFECRDARPAWEGYDFGTLYHPDPVVNDTGAGCGLPSGYRNDLFTGGVAAEAYTGDTDQLSASLWNNAGATTRVDNDGPTTYHAASAENDVIGFGSGNGYGVSTGYRNDKFTTDIAAHGYMGYDDPLSAPLRNNIGATPYIDYDWNSAYIPAPAMNNIVGSGSGNGYGVSTGYCNDMFIIDIAATGYTGHVENNVGATSYNDYGRNSAYTAAPVVNNIVGSGSGNGYGVSTGYRNDNFTTVITATGFTGHADPLRASLGNNAGHTTSAGHGWNPAYTPAPVVTNIAGSGSARPPAPIGPARVSCTHPNCSRTFGRQSDMARHAKKHELAPVRYPCPVPGCAFAGAKAFLRHDKLLSHGRNAHGMEL